MDERNNYWISTGIREIPGDDNSRMLYIGQGQEYGRVAKGDNDFKEFVYSPFWPFPAKADKGKNKLVPDLEGDSVHQRVDSKSKVYKYTIPFYERIRNVLKTLENPEEVFLSELEQEEGSTQIRHLKYAKDKTKILSDTEYIYFQEDGNDKYWTNEKRLKDISIAHRAICLIEWPDFLQEFKNVEVLEKRLEEEYGEGWHNTAVKTEEFQSYKKNLEDLQNKAVEYYNQQNGELVIE